MHAGNELKVQQYMLRTRTGCVCIACTIIHSRARVCKKRTSSLVLMLRNSLANGAAAAAALHTDSINKQANLDCCKSTHTHNTKSKHITASLRHIQTYYHSCPKASMSWMQDCAHSRSCSASFGHQIANALSIYIASIQWQARVISWSADRILTMLVQLRQSRVSTTNV